MNQIYILALLFAVASANLGADVSYYPATRTTFTCLAQQNVTLTILEIWDETGTVNPNFLNNYIYSKDAQIPGFDALVMVNDTFADEDLCNGVARALPKNFNGTVWLDVENKQGLWSRDTDDRISYLEAVIKTCQQHGLNPGVYSSADVWATVMGSQGIGSDTLSAVPVWYFNDNNVQNFDDFSYAGFGTWEKPQMKNYGTNAYLCGSYITSLDYYEN